MLNRLLYDYLGTRYVFVDARSHRPSRVAGDSVLEHVPRSEARWVLETMARREPALFDRLCRGLGGRSEPALQDHAWQYPAITGDPRLRGVLEALGVDRLSGPSGSPPRFARMYLLRGAAVERSTSARQDSPESQSMGRALAELGDKPLVFRGDSYRLARAGLVARRDLYETLAEAELFTALRAWIADTAAPDALKATLTTLLSLATTQREKAGSTELLLLRRVRATVRRVEESGPPITPSQLRKASERHWIEVQALGKDEKPVAGVALELVLATGDVRKLNTGDDGFARVDGLPAGDVIIRLPKLDASLWRPVGGAGASPSSHQRPSTSYTVKRGDSLAKIARKLRLRSWKDVWEHAANAALREKRKHPNRIQPGDTLTLPAARVHEIVRAIDATHRLEVERFRAVVSVLNAHLVSDPGRIDAHSHLPAAKLSASTSLHEDAASTTVRLHDVPERVSLALVAPAGGAASDAPSQEASA